MLKETVIKILRSTGKFIPQLPNKSISKIFSEPNAHIFFGYYDITPFNYSDEKVLACRVPINKSSDNETMDLGYYNLDEINTRFSKFGETKTWCWQMGPRLRWLNKEKNCVAFNSIEKDRYICKVLNTIDCDLLEQYPLPFYDIDKSENYGISINFSRLQRLRPGYGYNIIPDETEGIKAPSDDGIMLYNLKNKKQNLLVSLSEISEVEPNETMINAEHYFNHISFSPFSNDFIFFHLWIKDNRRYSRLFIYDLETKNNNLISKNMVSHYAWKLKNELLITERDKQGFFYRIYNLTENSSYIYGKRALINDGHPSFINADSIITDTYPNKLGYQQLQKYDSNQKQIKKIISLYSPPIFHGENKCDLHPRLNRKKDLICIDTAMSGKREMILVSCIRDDQNQDQSH